MTLKMTYTDPAWQNLKLRSLKLFCSSGIFWVIREKGNFWLTLLCLGPPVAKIGVLPDITNSVSKAANKGDYYMWKPDKSNDALKARSDFYKKPTCDARTPTNRFLAKETIVPFTRKRFLSFPSQENGFYFDNPKTIQKESKKNPSLGRPLYLIHRVFNFRYNNFIRNKV